MADLPGPTAHSMSGDALCSLTWDQADAAKGGGEQFRTLGVAKRTPPLTMAIAAVAFQLGEGAAHRLDREPEEIGNVLTAHRQRDRRRRAAGADQPVAPAHQERGPFPWRRRPSSSICSWAWLSSRAANSFTAARSVPPTARRNSWRFCKPSPALRRRRKNVWRCPRPRQGNRPTVQSRSPPPVRQQLAKPHHAFGHIVDGLGCLVFQNRRSRF